MSVSSQIGSPLEAQHLNPYDDLKLKMSVCQLFYKHQCGTNYYIEELSMIQQQCQLMEQIRNAISSKKVATGACQWDRETTRDLDVSTLSQVRSTDRLLRVRSPNHSFTSSKASRLSRRISAASVTERLLEEVQRSCSSETHLVLQKVLEENKQARLMLDDYRRLKSELAKLKQELEHVKQTEIATAARLYETSKQLIQCQAKVSEARTKREEYSAKLVELETRQVQLNRAEIACMVREKMVRNQSISLKEWSDHTERYKRQLCRLKESIENVITSPQAHSYRALAGTIISSLEAQETEIDQQSRAIGRLSKKMDQLLKLISIQP